jgi:hypothetical protein
MLTTAAEWKHATHWTTSDNVLLGMLLWRDVNGQAVGLHGIALAKGPGHARRIARELLLVRVMREATA